MQPEKTNKALYGFMAFGPLGLILLGMVPFILFMVAMEGRGGGADAGIAIMVLVMIMIFGGSILSIVSLIMYIMHIAKNPRVPEDQRIMWILGMVFINGIVQIVYFFTYITKEDEIDRAREAVAQQQWGGQNPQDAQNPWKN